MPELPEVETVRRVLKSELLNLKIVSYTLHYEKIFENLDEISKILNNKIIDIDRKGKFLIFIFEKGYLVSHLRMEGKYFYLKDFTLNKHMHVIFDLSNGYHLIYQDVRKFGRMHYFDSYDEVLSYMNLGLDANDLNIDVDSLYKRITKIKKPIKAILLNQNIIAGLGNIYVDEVLYKSKLMPNVLGSELNFDDVKNIVNNSKIILDNAIINKGTTIRSYTSSLGVTGNYQNFLACHTKEKCTENHLIFKMKIDGRTTYYCPICQKFKKKIVIGLTGSISSGKSNISNNLKQLGFVVSDADLIVKEAYNDINVLNQIKENFPDTFNNNICDKKKLGEIIFNDEKKREILNKIIHPFVLEKMQEDIKNNDLIFLDVPLLYEANFDKLCDRVICTKLDLDKQIERLINRDDITKEEALLKINSQMKLEDKCEKADYLIDTSKDFKDTYKNLLECLSLLFSEL